MKFRSVVAHWLSGLAVTASFSLGGCRHDTDERLGLDDKHAVGEFDVSALARAGELEKAVAAPVAEVEKKLGPYRLVESAKLTLGAGGAKGDKQDTLEDSWRLEIDGQGGSSILHENSKGYGFESVIAGGAVYIRPKYGRFVKRAPEGDEVERARDEAQGVLASWLSVLGRFAARKDAGATTFAGRPAHKVELSLLSSPARLRDGDPAHAWRRDMKVSVLSGEVLVDEKSGAPLHAVLDASYTAERGGESKTEIQVSLAYRGEIESVGAITAIAAPADFVPAPVRVRPLLDKQLLLDGLAAPPAAATGSDK